MYLYGDEKVIAGIVLYNPKLQRLEENICALLKQVDEIVLMDNHSVNEDEIRGLSEKYSKIVWIRLDQNYGIAYALNEIMFYAAKESINWVLTMDQDSIANEKLVEMYYKYINMPDVMMMTCKICDRNTDGNRCLNYDGETLEYHKVNKCITSGCFTNVKKCVEIGGFDNKLFIDYVDYELCIRCIQSGYSIIEIDFPGLLHEVGKAKRVQLFGRNLKIAGKYFDIYNEIPLRVYYFFRNTTYIVRKYGRSAKGYTSILHIIWRAFLVICYEKPKWLKFQMICKGVKDGFRMPI